MTNPLIDPYALGSLPTGRRLDQNSDALPEGVLGNISRFPRATEQRIKAARKNAREIPDERIDRSTDPWTDRETGEEFEPGVPARELAERAGHSKPSISLDVYTHVMPVAEVHSEQFLILLSP